MKKFMFIINALTNIIDMSKLGDTLLDAVEDYVQKTDNTTDDKLVLPAIKALRLAMDFPDNDTE